MKTAKKRVQDILNDSEPTEAEIQKSKENLKLEINNLLHCHLPGRITLDQTEALAMVIHEMIYNPDDFINPSKTKL